MGNLTQCKCHNKRDIYQNKHYSNVTINGKTILYFQGHKLHLEIKFQDKALHVVREFPIMTTPMEFCHAILLTALALQLVLAGVLHNDTHNTTMPHKKLL